MINDTSVAVGNCVRAEFSYRDGAIIAPNLLEFSANISLGL